VSVYTIIPLLVHSSFCLLDFMFPACRPNLAENFRTIKRVEQACYCRKTYSKIMLSGCLPTKLIP
jgi:hypothetical protein